MTERPSPPVGDGILEGARLGRKVVGFMSDDSLDPELCAEVFVLQPVAAAAA